MFEPWIDISPGQEREFREASLAESVVGLAVTVVFLYVLRWLGAW